MRSYRFWTYMLTNWTKTVLYTGVTNDIAMRLVEHWIGRDGCFTSRYHVYYLIWYEETQYVLNAIRREKEIKNVLKLGTIESSENKTVIEVKFYYPKTCGGELTRAHKIELVKSKGVWFINDLIYSDGSRLTEDLKRAEY